MADHVELWHVEDRRATRTYDGYALTALDGEDIWGCLRRSTPWFEDGAMPFRTLRCAPGSYYPRIARPTWGTWPNATIHPANAENAERIAQICVQIASLASSLQTICRTVEPKDDNLHAYGHDIRNLLILACTEVEASWRGVLLANGHKAKTTEDYVRLITPLRLREYSAYFPTFPGLGDFRPFQDWDASKSTQSLTWYDAYNAVKHDRESNFQRASLLFAFEAVSACAILLAAQFGAAAWSEFMPTPPYVQIRTAPSWEIEDLYFPDPEGGGWSASSLQL